MPNTHRKEKIHRGFIPSNPQNQFQTQVEINNWRADLAEKKAQYRLQVWSFILSAIAALAAVAGLILQIVRG